MTDSVSHLPSRIQVEAIVSSRYSEFPLGGRPASWDERREGVDVVRTNDGKVLSLLSDGQQSTPKKGWVLMLTEGDAASGYRWTLYGSPKQAL